MSKPKILTNILIILITFTGCGKSTSGNNYNPSATNNFSFAESEAASESEIVPHPDSLNTFVPRDSDCICSDHCTADSTNIDCPVCNNAAVEELDSVCLGIYPELYEDENLQYVYFDSEEVYAPGFLPIEVWNSLPNSLPLYLQSMGLSEVHELHYVEDSIVNTDVEKSFVFFPEGKPDIQIKVSYIDGKLDYNMSIGGRHDKN